jgi:hypothetical protein
MSSRSFGRPPKHVDTLVVLEHVTIPSAPGGLVELRSLHALIPAPALEPDPLDAGRAVVGDWM